MKNDDFIAAVLARGTFADLFLEESANLSVRYADKRVEDVSQGLSAGAGLRFMKNGETRFGHLAANKPVSQALSAEDNSRLSALAKTLSQGLAPSRRPAWTPGPKPPHTVKVNPEAISLKSKITLMERADKAARAYSLVHQVNVTYGEKIKRVKMMNSLGQICEEERVYLFFAVHVTAAKGSLLQTAYEVAGGLGGHEIFQHVMPEWLGETAAKRALAKLVAPSAPAGEFPVVIASVAGGTLIHEAIGHALEADTIQQGASPHFSGKIGQVVANPLVTVLDDPTVPARRGTYFYDDEGVPAQRTVLVDKGVLKTYLYDRRSAKRDQVSSNGHGRRESYAHIPIPRMSNTFIAPGTDSPEAIVQSLARGLYVTRMGGGQVNTATGDFVFEVEEGHLIENGRVKNPVRGATLLGNGPEVLRTIDRVGSDLGWSLGTCGKDGQGVPVADGVPTLRIPKIVVGGK